MSKVETATPSTESKPVYEVCRVHRHRFDTAECPNAPDGVPPVHVFKGKKVTLMPKSVNPVPYTSCIRCGAIAMYPCGPVSRVSPDWKPFRVRIPKETLRWGATEAK